AMLSGRSSTSAPRVRAAAAISGSSVETTVRLTVALPSAASTVHASIGLPPSGVRFFRGIPFEPPRAGMRARTSCTAQDFHVSGAPRSGKSPDVFDHVTIRASDREASERFYDTVLGTLRIEKSHTD